MVRHLNYYVVGARGSGKTHLALHLAAYRSRVLYVDPTSTQRGTWTHYDPDALVEVIQTADLYDAVWTCGHLSDQEMREGLDRLLSSLERTGRQDTVVVDELAVVAPGRRRMDGPLRTARMGRHNSTSVWLLSQRAVDASADWRAVMDRLILFRQHERADLDALRRVHPDLPEEVRRLPDRHFLAYDLTRGTWTRHKPLRAPSR